MPGVSKLSLLVGAAGLWQTAESKALFHFDCESGYAHWHAAWSVEKKRWCCNYVSRGCPGDKKATEEGFDCHDGFVGKGWMRAWSHLKKDWCCVNSKSWSNNHQPFCCARKKGCHKDIVNEASRGRNGVTTTQAPDPYYCLAPEQAAWTKEKQDWCCANKDKGCPLQIEVPSDEPPTTARLATGGSSPNGDGSSSSTGSGAGGQNSAELVDGVVTGGAGRTPPPGDGCSQGDHGLWDDQKTCHCCKHYGIACPPVYYPPDIPPDDALICDYARLYETGAGNTMDISKVGISLNKVAAGGALGFLFSAIALVVVRRSFRKAAGGQGPGYTAMPGQQADFLLTEAGAQEPKALEEELS